MFRHTEVGKSTAVMRQHEENGQHLECRRGHDHCCLRRKRLYQCNRCHHQTSVTVGTLFESTKLGLKTWFLGMYLITQNKDGISSLSLVRHLGISQNSAWLLKHKLMQVMLERDNQQPLAGRIELDDAYWGGERHGGKRGRGASGKHPFIAGVQSTEDEHPMRLKCSAVPDFRKDTIERWCRQLLAHGSHVVSDAFPVGPKYSNLLSHHSLRFARCSAQSFVRRPIALRIPTPFV